MAGILDPKTRIKKLIKRMQTGVYKIVNNKNNRIYIGSAINIKARWRTHLSRLKLGRHHNQFLLADYNKCGRDLFTIEILEECSVFELLSKEQYWLDQFYDNQQQCYNLRAVAESNRGWKHSSATRKKMSLIHKGRKPALQTIEASKVRMKGKTWEEIYGPERASQMRQNMSLKTIKRFQTEDREFRVQRSKKSWSVPEYKAKMIEIHKKRYAMGAKHPQSRKIAQYDKAGNLIAIFENAVEAAKVLGLLSNCMRQVATGKKKTHAGFVWRYI